jgi:hypothetical protein
VILHRCVWLHLFTFFVLFYVSSSYLSTSSLIGIDTHSNTPNFLKPNQNPDFVLGSRLGWPVARYTPTAHIPAIFEIELTSNSEYTEACNRGWLGGEGFDTRIRRDEFDSPQEATTQHLHHKTQHELNNNEICVEYSPSFSIFYDPHSLPKTHHNPSIGLHVLLIISKGDAVLLA